MALYFLGPWSPSNTRRIIQLEAGDGVGAGGVEAVSVVVFAGSAVVAGAVSVAVVVGATAEVVEDLESVL